MILQMPWKSCFLICFVYVICGLNVLEGKVVSGSDEPSYSQSGQSFCDSRGNWKNVWSDDFDHSTLDKTVWTIPVGVGNSFGREANVTKENTYIENGNLVLRSQRSLDNTDLWTTGAAITSHQPGSDSGKNWQYGRFCIRAQLPGDGLGKSKGIWPAHWMMPSDYSKHCGYNEIDIMEMVNGDGQAWGTYWFWGPNGKPPGSKNCTEDPVRAACQNGTRDTVVPDYWYNFHEYAIEWTPCSLTYFVDSKPYQTYGWNNKSILPINPHFLMLNTAVGGPWPGHPNVNTTSPVYHRIDFVRVSQKVSYDECGAA
jgi:beta-glucanase (GH16 family)